MPLSHVFSSDHSISPATRLFLDRLFAMPRHPRLVILDLRGRGHKPDSNDAFPWCSSRIPFYAEARDACKSTILALIHQQWLTLRLQSKGTHPSCAGQVLSELSSASHKVKPSISRTIMGSWNGRISKISPMVMIPGKRS